MQIRNSACTFNDPSQSPGHKWNCGLNALEVLGIIDSTINKGLTFRCHPDPIVTRIPGDFCFSRDRPGMSTFSILDVMRSVNYPVDNFKERNVVLNNNDDFKRCLQSYFDRIEDHLKNNEGMIVFVHSPTMNLGHVVVIGKIEDELFVIDKQFDPTVIRFLDYFAVQGREVYTAFTILEDHNDPYFESLDFNCIGQIDSDVDAPSRPPHARQLSHGAKEEIQKYSLQVASPQLAVEPRLICPVCPKCSNNMQSITGIPQKYVDQGYSIIYCDLCGKQNLQNEFYCHCPNRNCSADYCQVCSNAISSSA